MTSDFNSPGDRSENQSIPELIDNLRSPQPLESLDELGELIAPKPKYVGPGLWLNILKEETLSKIKDF